MEIRLSEIIENIDTGHITEWLVEDGSEVLAGQDILELVTDKASFSVCAPFSGKLSIKAPEGTKVSTKDIICQINQKE